MKKPLGMLLVAVLIVGGCSGFRDSRLNPFNWFGHSTQTATTLAPKGGYQAASGDNRALVAQVVSLRIDRSPGGAIVHATGLPPTQGWWDGELVAENDGMPVDGVLSYRFLLAAPHGRTAVSTPQSREVTVAVFLSRKKLEQVHRIVVNGQTNARSLRR